MALPGLKNAARFFLRSFRHFEEAKCMSDQAGALALLASTPTEALEGGCPRARALAAFEAEWGAHREAVDSWLTCQACSSLPDPRPRLERLMEHASFTLTNPNKVRDSSSTSRRLAFRAARSYRRFFGRSRFAPAPPLPRFGVSFCPSGPRRVWRFGVGRAGRFAGPGSPRPLGRRDHDRGCHQPEPRRLTHQVQPPQAPKHPLPLIPFTLPWVT